MDCEKCRVRHFKDFQDDDSQHSIAHYPNKFGPVGSEERLIIEFCSLHAAAGELLGALKEIVQGKGAYNQDQLIHCSNTVEDMKTIARAAIAKAEGKSPA